MRRFAKLGSSSTFSDILRTLDPHIRGETHDGCEMAAAVPNRSENLSDSFSAPPKARDLDRRIAAPSFGSDTGRRINDPRVDAMHACFRERSAWYGAKLTCSCLSVSLSVCPRSWAMQAAGRSGGST